MVMLPNSFISGVYQVALVVHDVEETMKSYTQQIGIGPWRVALLEPPRLTDTRVRGESVEYSFKYAVAWTGDTMWEIIEPVDGPSIYKEFLNDHGEGIHHILVQHEGLDFDTALEQFGKRGCPPAMEGRIGDIRFAYLESEGPLKTTLEIVDRPPGAAPVTPDYWYPAEQSDSGSLRQTT